MSYQFHTHCPNCFKPSITTCCSHCRFDRETYMHDDAASHYLRPFTVLERGYVIGRVLGEGSFAIVYAAIRETDSLPCAIKEYYPNALAKRGVDGITINPKRNQDLLDSWKKRFIQEATLLRRCYEAPSIESGVVRYLDLIVQNNSAYLVMERLEGNTLTKLLRTHRTLSAESICLWLRPFLETLQKLHDKQIYHRDISPSNIILCANNRPVLMDFGLAREGARDELLKSSAIGRGTFIAPEQLTGGYCDHRTDFYSLGAIIYRCLLGHTPPQIEARRQGASLSPLIQGSKTAQALQKIAEHCLQLDIKKRPKNAAAISATLAPYWGDASQLSFFKRLALFKPLYPDLLAIPMRKHSQKSKLILIGLIGIAISYNGFLIAQSYYQRHQQHQQFDQKLWSQSVQFNDFKKYLAECQLCEQREQAQAKLKQWQTTQQSTDQQRLIAHIHELQTVANKQGSSDLFYQQYCPKNSFFWERLAQYPQMTMAQHLLAGCYLLGYGVKQDSAEAAHWYRQAAEHGNALAQTNLGFLYANGYGVTKDLVTAVSWYRKAAEQGNTSGQVKLAWMYQHGMGVEHEDKQAFFWYRKAAEQGNITGQARLASLYDEGIGVERDIKQAIFWYRKAAEQGSVMSQTNLGWMYDVGAGVTQDTGQAVMWYRKAADQGVPEAQARLGWMYQNGLGITQDYQQAVYWYRKAAAQGIGNAQANLGWMYLNGLGVPLDYQAGLEWSRKAADQGNAVGQFNLGWIYQNGKGVMRDYAEAAVWYHKAAEQGDSSGQFNLGWMYQNGQGVGQDDKQAVVWYRKAAEQGDVDAQVNLAWMYQNGYGVIADNEQARKWYQKAADQGDHYAVEQLRSLTNR